MIIFLIVFVFKHVGLSWMILYLKQAEFECEKKCLEWVEGGVTCDNTTFCQVARPRF